MEVIYPNCIHCGKIYVVTVLRVETQHQVHLKIGKPWCGLHPEYQNDCLVGCNAV
jgi:hypothetical protein